MHIFPTLSSCLSSNPYRIHTLPSRSLFLTHTVIKGWVYSPSESYDLINFNGGSTTRLDTKTGFNGETSSDITSCQYFALNGEWGTSKARVHQLQSQEVLRSGRPGACERQALSPARPDLILR